MPKAELYTRFPVASVVTYNLSTILHFLLGGLIITSAAPLIGYWAGVLASLYVILSLFQMYLYMPYKVCTHCVYFGLENSRCITGLNAIAKRVFKPAAAANLSTRAKGAFCPNNLYIASLALPILAGIPILVFSFSPLLLGLELLLFVLLAIRFVYLIPKTACVHCRAKFVCPQAGQMGVRDK